jgi:RNA polymerase sigma-70 factor (ECF subfamily)
MSGDERSSTEGLVRSAQDADPDAFSELLRRCRGRLDLWVALRMGPLLKSRLSKDDVMQETFLEAYRSIGDFDPRGSGSFRRWLLSIAENRLRDLSKYHTAQKRDPAREAGPPAASPDEADLLRHLGATGRTPSSGAHWRDLGERLRQAIEKLPEAQREVLVLRAIEERTFKEIAERLGKRPATVQVHYLRALKSLKDELTATRA